MGPSGDPVNNPSHYEEGRKYSPLSVMTDWQLPPLEWQCVKYLSRLGRKDSVIKDLDKVSFYLLYRIAIELGIEDDDPRVMVRKAAERVVKNNSPEQVEEPAVQLRLFDGAGNFFVGGAEVKKDAPLLVSSTDSRIFPSNQRPPRIGFAVGDDHSMSESRRSRWRERLKKWLKWGQVRPSPNA